MPSPAPQTAASAFVVLVCGGRRYANREVVRHALDVLKAEHPNMAVIQGGASGADALAREWCRSGSVPCLSYLADWTRHGGAAGPIRNRRMLTEGKPDLVVAFPGERGTKNMIALTVRAGIPLHCPM